MQYRAAALNATVMAAPYDFPIMHDDGADGDTALMQPLSGFLDCGLEKRIHKEDFAPVLCGCAAAVSVPTKKLERSVPKQAKSGFPYFPIAPR